MLANLTLEVGVSSCVAASPPFQNVSGSHQQEFTFSHFEHSFSWHSLFTLNHKHSTARWLNTVVGTVTDTVSDTVYDTGPNLETQIQP